MKAPNWKKCSEEEVWKYVGWHLAKNGIETILVGGAVAAIYSDGAYKSGDLDFVLKTYLIGKIPEIMSPTDCIRDRLASFIHYKARECLDQAVLVAKRYPFNQKKVKDWCADEGGPQAYDDLMKKLKSSKK